MAEALEEISPSHSHRDLLNSHYRKCMDNISPDALVPYLVQNKVLTIPEVDCVKDEKGTQNKVHRILMYIHQKPPEVFRRFIVSLREGSHPHVANVLSLPPNVNFDTSNSMGALNDKSTLCGKACDKGILELRILASAVEKKVYDHSLHGTVPADSIASLTAKGDELLGLTHPEGDKDMNIEKECISKCCPSLYIDILQVLEKATERLGTVVDHEHIDELPELAELVNKCYLWLKSLENHGIAVGGAHSGSVILITKCKSSKALEYLWNQWATCEINDQLEQIFLPHLEEKYRQYRISLEVRIRSDQYLHCYRELVVDNALRSISTDLSASNLEDGNVTSPSWSKELERQYESTLSEIDAAMQTLTPMPRETWMDWKRSAPNPNENPLAAAVFWKDKLENNFSDVIGHSPDSLKEKSYDAVAMTEECAEILDDVASQSNRATVTTVGIMTLGVLAAPFTGGASLAVAAGLVLVASAFIIKALHDRGWTKSNTEEAQQATKNIMNLNKQLEEFLTICVYAFTQAKNHLETKEGKDFVAFLRANMGKTGVVNPKKEGPMSSGHMTHYTLQITEYIVEGRFARADVHTALQDASRGVRIGDRYISISRSSSGKMLSIDWDAHIGLLEGWLILLGIVKKASVRKTADDMKKLADQLNTTTNDLSFIYESIRGYDN